MPLLSLIIPCYNEENTLRPCIDMCLHLRHELQKQNISLELLIIDDASTDQSYTIAKELEGQHPEMISVYRHEKNMGKGAAVRTALNKTRGDMVGIQDADTEYNPLDYLLLIKPILDDKADVVYGSRYLQHETRRVLYFWHTWMNKSLTSISNMFTNLDISDMETCYKLFRKSIIQSIAPHLQENRFGFEPEITARIAQTEARVYECAINYTPRSYEEGKKISWKDGVRALYCIMHYSAHAAPLPMQIILYFFIGLCAAILNLIAFSFALLLNIPLFAAILSAFCIAAIFNYFLCITILFKHKARWSRRGEIIAYLFAIALMALLDLTLTTSLHALGIHIYFAKIIGIILGFAGNFALRKYLVF